MFISGLALDGILDADFGFMVDTSIDVTSAQIKSQYEFIKFLAFKFGLSVEAFHLGLITYAEVAKLQMAFNEYRNLAAFNSAMDKLSLAVGGEARLDAAFELAQSNLFTAASGMRNGKPR